MFNINAVSDVWSVFNVDIIPVIKDYVNLDIFGWWNTSFSRRSDLYVNSSYMNDNKVSGFPVLFKTVKVRLPSSSLSLSFSCPY